MSTAATTPPVDERLPLTRLLTLGLQSTADARRAAAAGASHAEAG